MSDMNKPTPGTVRLFEVATGCDFKVDVEQGVIRDVRVLGPESGNGRTYPADTIAKARSLYEGVRVNVDHPPKDEPDRDTPVSSRFGWLANVHEDKGGLTGDLYYLKSHPQSAPIIEAAQRRPQLFGLSHNADGRIRREDGKAVVEEILRVRSVDIVSDPATTRSLFESQETQAMVDELAPPVDSVSVAAAGDPIKEMLLAKIAEIYDGEGDPATKAKAIGAVAKEVLKVQDAIDNATSADASADAAAATESLRREVATLKTRVAVRELLESEGVSPNPAVIKALESLTSDVDRKALLAAMPKTAGEAVKPRSTGRLAESVGSGGAKFEAPKDSKEFASVLTGGRRS